METRKSPLMKIIAGILLLAVVVTGAIVLYNNKVRIEQLDKQNAGLNTTLQNRDSLVNELTSTFDEIEDNLTFVRNKRSQLTLASPEGTQNQKDILVADIKLMNEMLEESSIKMVELEKKLKASGIEVQSFKNKIARLNQNILEQDNSIKQLTSELEQRDYKIAELDQQVVIMKGDIASKEDTINIKSQIIAAKEEIIEVKDNELNKVYFVSGTAKELLEKGVIQREGGFLGLGKNTDLKDNINENNFSALDQRTTVSLPIFSKKAEVITEHPTGSYELVYQNDQVAYLQIEDPAEFWKLTKYLVVETK